MGGLAGDPSAVHGRRRPEGRDEAKHRLLGMIGQSGGVSMVTAVRPGR